MKTESESTAEESSNDRQPVPHARMSRVRFILLFILILVAFTNEYAFNNPQALEESMQQILNITETQFQLLYSLYALPNVFTLFFLGYLCDLVGSRIGLISLSAGIAIFQLVIALGGSMNSYGVLLVAESALAFFQKLLISKWFQGTEQAFALGIGITFPQLGNAFNSFLTPLIYEHTHNLGDPLMFSFGLCVFGFLMACLAAYLDIRADRIDERNHVHISQEEEEELIKCSDVRKLKKEFWITVSICTMAMTLWIPFMDNVNRLFQKRFCYSQTSAGDVITLPYIFAVVLSIPLGIVVDKYGHRRSLSILGLLFFLGAQVIILLYPQCQGTETTGVILGLVLEGIGYAFYANVLVASIPLVCKLKLLGTAFGIMEMLECFFQFLVPIVTGAVVSSASEPEIGYRISSAIFTGIGIIGVFVGSALYWGIKEEVKTKMDRPSSENVLLISHKKVSSLFVANSSLSDQQALNNWLLKGINSEKIYSIEIPHRTT